MLERAESEAAVIAEPAAAGPAGSQLTPHADVVVRFVLRAVAGPGLHTGVVGLVLASCCIPLSYLNPWPAEQIPTGPRCRRFRERDGNGRVALPDPRLRHHQHRLPAHSQPPAPAAAAGRAWARRWVSVPSGPIERTCVLEPGCGKLLWGIVVSPSVFETRLCCLGQVGSGREWVELRVVWPGAGRILPRPEVRQPGEGHLFAAATVKLLQFTRLQCGRQRWSTADSSGGSWSGRPSRRSSRGRLRAVSLPIRERRKGRRP